MSREVFHVVMAAGLVFVLLVGLLRLNWVAVGWACFGLLSSLASIAMDRRARREAQR